MTIERKTVLYIAATGLAVAAMCITWWVQSNRRAAVITDRRNAEDDARQMLLRSAKSGSLELPTLPLAVTGGSVEIAPIAQTDREASSAILNAAAAIPFTREDAIVVIRGLDPERHLTTQRTSIVAMGQVLKDNTTADEDVKGVFRQAIIQCLSSKNEFITSSSLAAAKVSGLALDPSVQLIIESRMNDKSERIAVMARKLLDSVRSQSPPSSKPGGGG